MPNSGTNGAKRWFNIHLGRLILYQKSSIFLYYLGMYRTYLPTYSLHNFIIPEKNKVHILFQEFNKKKNIFLEVQKYYNLKLFYLQWLIYFQNFAKCFEIGKYKQFWLRTYMFLILFLLKKNNVFNFQKNLLFTIMLDKGKKPFPKGHVHVIFINYISH